ncbi:OPT/YSL family transporter [Patescibacteria group bacterium]
MSQGTGSVREALAPFRRTLSGTIIGFIMAHVLCVVNMYVTLKIGVMEEGFVSAALMYCMIMMPWFMILWLIGKITGNIRDEGKKRFTSENLVMVGTIGSAGGSFAFMGNFFAAYEFIGQPLTIWQMAGFSFLGSVLGLAVTPFFRELFLVKHKLPWPMSQAAIEFIKTITDSGEEAMKRVKLMAVFMGLTVAFIVLHTLFPKIVIGAYVYKPMAALGVGIALSPLLLGAGLLIGLRTGMGFLAGAVIMLVFTQYIPLYPVKPPHVYMWPGIGFLIAIGITDVVMKRKILWEAAQVSFGWKEKEKTGEQQEDQAESQKVSKFAIGALILVITIFAHIWFGVAWYAMLITIALGVTILNLICNLGAGTTGFNPVRVAGVILVVIAAGIMGGPAPAISLAAAILAGASIGASALLLQDQVIGHEFKVTPKTQMIAQGVTFLSVSILSAYAFNMIKDIIGVNNLYAPVAKLWAGSAQIATKGGSLPPYTYHALAIGAMFGIIFGIVDHYVDQKIGKTMEEDKTKKLPLLNLIPRGLGIGLALILPIFYNTAFFAGGLICAVLILTRVTKSSIFIIGSALIVADGITNLIIGIGKQFI